MLYQSGYSRMLSNTRTGFGFIVLAAACVGGAGYAGALSVADGGPAASGAENGPQGTILRRDNPAQPAGANFPPPPAEPRPDALSTTMPHDVAVAAGPRATSGESRRYDSVGYATWYGEEMQGSDTASGEPFDPSGITAAHRTLPLGSIIEVTALDTGRTILALVNDRGPGKLDMEVDLSRGAAQSLGVTGVAPVRIRLVTASAPDVMALREGQAASRRIDAPPALLVALRRKLPVRTAVAVATAPQGGRAAPRGSAETPHVAPFTQVIRSPLPAIVPAAKAKPAIGTAATFVQVAALSHEGRAKALATTLHGRVQRVGTIFRIQIGPYANTALAKAARDEVASRGYGDARIVQTN